MTEASQAAARAVDDLFRRHGSEVYRYALAVLGNHSDAEDVTQTTFLNAYRAIEQGVRPRKPSNWLLTIASNAIKQKFRQESARPKHVALDDEIADASADDDGPTVGELLTALSRIPPQQRQAIVLREFEGRSYKEIGEILGVTTAALETLLFRARRSLAEELEHQLTCTEAQHAISRAADGRLGRKERRRLRTHLAECPDCSRFAHLQKRHRVALRGLLFVPVPVTFSLLRGLEGTATAATLPSAAAGTAAGATVAASASGLGAAGAGGGGLLAGGVAVKAAAVVTAASVAGGVGVVGASELGSRPDHAPGRPAMTENGARLGQVAPRGVSVPGKGIARGKPTAPGPAKAAAAKQRATRPAGAKPGARASTVKAKAAARARGTRAVPPRRGAAARPKASAKPSASARPSSNAKPKASAKPAPAAQPEPKAIEPEATEPANEPKTPPAKAAPTQPSDAGGETAPPGQSENRGGGKPTG